MRGLALRSLLVLALVGPTGSMGLAQVENFPEGDAPQSIADTIDSALVPAEPSFPEPSFPEPPAPKPLDRRTRSRAFAALAGLVILGVALVVFASLSARMTRRYMKSGEKRPAAPVDSAFTDDWAQKPLTPEERERLASENWE